MGVGPQGEPCLNLLQIKAQLSTRRVQAGLIWKGKSGVNLGALPLVAMRTIHDAFDAPQHTGDSLDPRRFAERPMRRYVSNRADVCAPARRSLISSGAGD